MEEKTIENLRSQYIEEIIKITKTMAELINRPFAEYSIYDDVEYYRLLSEKNKYEEQLDKLF